ncbi:MAG: hypothetical protein LBL45_06520 [Treponema sp.]|jgi:hypothetical protein|nr:hypothetical protein [Treponema sp.]
MITSNGKKYFEYNDIEDAEKPVFTITKGDIQLEAQQRMGRLLADDEVDKVVGYLEWGICESIGIVYASAFQDL